MSTYGRINEFKQGAQSWEEYMELVTNFFGANEIENEDKKRMIFLTSVGTDIFHLMSTLVSPNSLNTKSIAELADRVQHHLDPKPSKIV